MSNISQSGFYWRNDTVVVVNQPNGCRYTSTAYPLGDAARDGFSACTGAQVKFSGAAILGNASITRCELRVNQGNGWYAVAAGVPSGAYFVFSSDWHNVNPIPNSTLTVAVVYQIGTIDWYGAVLETDIPTHTYSSIDPTITISDTQSFFDGDHGNCIFGGSGECAVSAGSRVTGTMLFHVEGGSSTGVDGVTSKLEEYNLTSSGQGWRTIATGQLGNLGTGLFSSDLTFTYPYGVGLIGRKYRMSISHPSVTNPGTIKTYTGIETTLYPEVIPVPDPTPDPAPDPTPDPTPDPIPTVCAPANCKSPKTCVAGVCTAPSSVLCSQSNCALPKTCVAGVCTSPSSVLCAPANCPSPKTCVAGVCTSPSGLSGTGTTACVDMSRNGSLDPTCALEKGNEIYLYGAIGLALLLFMRK